MGGTLKKSTLDELEIIERCLQNDRTAQKALYDRFSPKLYALVLRYARDTHEAGDILQESFISIFNFLHQYNKETPIFFWMRKICINTAIKYLKKDRVLDFHETSDFADGNEASHEEVFIHQEEYKLLLDLLNQLPEGYKVIFNLNVIEGFSHKKIATELGIDEGTSRSQLHKAKKMLQNLILLNKEKSQFYGK